MKKVLLLNLFLILFSVQITHAHSFHYELQVSSTLQLNDKKELESVKISWLYDGDVSDIMLQDQKDLKKLGKKVIEDISLLGFFTQIKLNGNTLAFNKIEDYKMEKLNNGEYDVLRLSFTLPFETTMSLKGDVEIGFSHEDPSASAILYYESDKNIYIGDLQKSCKASVKEKKKFEEGEFPQIVKVICKS